MILPKGNTISFYQVSDIDNRFTWSNPYNSSSIRYVPNTYSNNYLQPFVIGMWCKFQLIQDVEPVVYMVNKTTSTRDLLTGTNVSPVGWTGTAVWEFAHEFYTEGNHYVWVSDGDRLRVNSEYLCVTEENKNAVEILYSNSKNDFDMIFTQDDVNFNAFRMLCNGRWSLSTGNEVENITNDSGNVTTLDSVPVENYYLELSPIPAYMESKLNNIFSCDFLTINGLLCSMVDPIEVEKIGESNMKQLTVTLRINSQANNVSGFRTVIINGNTYIIDGYDIVVSD